MSLFFQEKELSELMQSFYLLTGIKIVLFDKDYNEVISYPSDRITFCMHMRQNENFDKQCRICDNDYCHKCAETKSLHIYKCHAGLTEAIMPIMKNNRIIGYMIFGQIHDNKNKSKFENDMKKLITQYGIKTDLEKSIKKIKYKNQSQIFAAATILKACVEYIQIKEIVRFSEKLMITTIEKFIDDHIDEELTVNRLCEEFKIKRTRLYELMSTYIDGGIASFIKTKRLSKAKELLLTTDMSVAEIAYSVGFSDYNYFLRTFKGAYGISPKKMLKMS